MSNNITATKKLNIGHGVIGTMPTGGRPTHSVLYPVLASRTIRDRDSFIQVNEDGKIFIMAAHANTEYTFAIPLPARY